MTISTSTSERRTGSAGRRIALVALVLLVAAAGVYVGVRWHADLASALGVKTSPTASSTPSHRQLWTCGMHPQVIQDHPGTCPICHMKLTPLTVEPTAAVPAERPAGAEKMASSDSVTIDPAMVQNMGVRETTVTQGPLLRSVRLVGYLDEAQPNIRDVNLLVSGWVRNLYADTEGMHVQAGDPLFDLYSPDLQIAVEELIAARRAKTGSPDQDATAMYDAAARKLELLGLPAAQVATLAKLDKAPEVITFTSPITGYISQKPIVQGAAVQAGQMALRIVDQTTLWLDARVFEQDLPFVHLGQQAVATITSQPGRRVAGKIIFIAPAVDASTRTALVRIELPNPDLTLKPGMYATVQTESQVAPSVVLVPREAVIDTGEDQLAFVSEGNGHFQPRRVKMGLAAQNGMVQIIAGLTPGETVVTSGQFLLDSESRLREAVQKFLAQKSAAPEAGTALSPEITGAPPSPEQQSLDAVVESYLTLAAALGESRKDHPALDPSALVANARQLQDRLSDNSHDPLVASVITAADALRGNTIDQQRKQFGDLSEKVIALIDACPPSSDVAPLLYLMHCPMAPGGKGDWLQTSTAVANPFFPDHMKNCGSLVRTITPPASSPSTKANP